MKQNSCLIGLERQRTSYGDTIENKQHEKFRMMWIPSCLEDGNMSIMHPDSGYRGRRHFLLVSFLEVVTNFIAKVDASNFNFVERHCNPPADVLVEFFHSMTEKNRDLDLFFFPNIGKC